MALKLDFGYIFSYFSTITAKFKEIKTKVDHVTVTDQSDASISTLLYIASICESA